MPQALRQLQSGEVQPVDLAQAAIGPGMAIFSRAARVLEPDGRDMSVRTALELINTVLGDLLGATDASLDPESSFALTWFQTYGCDQGPYGEAQTLARARNLVLESLVKKGIVESEGGQTRLVFSGQSPETAWGALHKVEHLVDVDLTLLGSPNRLCAQRGYAGAARPCRGAPAEN